MFSRHMPTGTKEMLAGSPSTPHCSHLGEASRSRSVTMLTLSRATAANERHPPPRVPTHGPLCIHLQHPPLPALAPLPHPALLV